jgi:trans-aconitate 2-methyltransferase
VPDHPALLARLTGLVADHGQLAIQVPTFRHPIYAAATAVAAAEPFRSALGGWTLESPVLEPEEYARLLFDLGHREQQVRLQVYAHVLPSREDVIEWVKGTLLTSYQERLPAECYDAFLRAYRERLFTMIADERPFLFTMSRMLCWARR